MRLHDPLGVRPILSPYNLPGLLVSEVCMRQALGFFLATDLAISVSLASASVRLASGQRPFSVRLVSV